MTEALASTTPVDGSTLCVACGLCCQGVLHDHVKVYAGEEEEVEKLGLAVEAHDNHSVFGLPCSLLNGNACTVYEHRPRTCSAYQCKLLKSFLAQEIPLQSALDKVNKVKGLIGNLRQHLPAKAEVTEGGHHGRTKSIWQQLSFRAQTDSSPENGQKIPWGTDSPQMMMDVTELHLLCRRDFKNRPGTTKVLTV